MEQRDCVCCGNSISYGCNIFSGDITGTNLSWETWSLCRPHYSERRKLSLIEFASNHKGAIEFLKETGFTQVAEAAELKASDTAAYESRFA